MQPVVPGQGIQVPLQVPMNMPDEDIQAPVNPNKIVEQYQTLRTDKVIKYDELDQGFILRANPEVTKVLRQIVKYGTVTAKLKKELNLNVTPKKSKKDKKKKKNKEAKQPPAPEGDVEMAAEEPKIEEAPKEEPIVEQDTPVSLELINLDAVKRLYGVKLNNTVFLATLVDLPCIIEAMKTLDYFNFYKSQDASQMLYVHPKRLDNWDRLKQEDLIQIIKDFNCLKDDEEFFSCLYERREIIKKMNDPEINQQKFWNEALRFRHGISPIAQNIRNIRYKKKPQFDIEQVKRIETILKDLIDFGFADHVDEQLLDFDEEGTLTKIIDGKNDRKGGVLSLMGQQQDDDIIKDDYGSASSSGDDLSSMQYKSVRGGNKSVMKSEFTSEKGGRPESNFQESASISNFRHDISSAKFQHSAQKPQNIISSLTIPGPDDDQSSNQMEGGSVASSAALEELKKLGKEFQLDEIKQEKKKLEKILDNYKKKITLLEKQGDSSGATELRIEMKPHLEQLKQIRTMIKKF